MTNKDLDLPTQQELLAQFRCDELATIVVESFNASAKVVRKPVETGSIVQGLGALMRDWLSTALGKFDRDASRYHSGVYQRKRGELLLALHSSLSPLFLGQVKNLHKTAAHRYMKDLTAGLKEPGYDFAQVVNEATQKAIDTFVAGAKGMQAM